MSDHRRNDEQLLIDYVLNECSDGERERMEKRLGEEGPLAALHEDIKRSFLAMELAPRENPPEDLIERTMSRMNRPNAPASSSSSRK